jgi:hypothetical protein
MTISLYKWLSKKRSIMANNHRRRAKAAKEAAVGNDTTDDINVNIYMHSKVFPK